MSDEFSRVKHTVFIENRENASLSGIKNVDAFNEEEIVALSDYGEIIIKGANLHVEALDLETGVLKINGNIGAVVYSDRSVPKGIFKKVFS